MEPALLLKDSRKLVYRADAPSRQIRELTESDILVGGDSATLVGAAPPKYDSLIEADFETDASTGADGGFDFAYVDRDGQRVIVELKLLSRKSPPASVREWLDKFAQIIGKSHINFARAELWTLTDGGARLTIWSDPDQTGTSYNLADVISMGRPLISARESDAATNSASVQRRVDAWRTQVRDLFSLITGWAVEAGYHADQTGTAQMDEELMKQFGVDAVQLPVLTIKKAKKTLATARPIGLWIIGANGRVDLLTAKAQAMIVNNSRDPADPVWQVYLSQSQSPQPFDSNFFINFLRSNERTETRSSIT